jgi:mycothiol synthase
VDVDRAVHRDAHARGADPLNVHEVTDWAQAAPIVTSILRASAEADGAPPLDEAALLGLKHHGLEGSRLWLEGQSAFALVRGESLDLVVAPEARGTGLGRELAAHAAPLAQLAWSHTDHPAARRLAGEFGWEEVRQLWVMRLAVASMRPSFPAPSPQGVTIRSFKPGDEPSILAINAAAFAHHPEQGSMDAENLAARMAEPWFDPEGLLIAEVDGEPTGFHWTKQHDARHGEVYVVGVGPAGQGRGLGRALTIAGVDHLAAKGVDEVLLYVEADNHPARNLYASLGFTHAGSDTHVQYGSPDARPLRS